MMPIWFVFVIVVIAISTTTAVISSIVTTKITSIINEKDDRAEDEEVGEELNGELKFMSLIVVRESSGPWITPNFLQMAVILGEVVIVGCSL
jgi:hypothetical protein